MMPVYEVLKFVAVGVLSINGCLNEKAEDKLKFAWVVNSPYQDRNGKIVEIKGTSQEVWGIKDVWDDPKALGIGAIVKYFLHNPPDYGQVYYGKNDSRGDCFHESWLKKLTQEEVKNYLDTKEAKLKAGDFSDCIKTYWP